ncbi:HAD-IIIC family phosphatase [Paenibacillus sp. EC2-1]|uniref:HAD-IIIC family phosphatase n=1 Tax=Paenibacillus sp. EC2-1 TaxID=3388665 RepID=UPI003BEEB7C6
MSNYKLLFMADTIIDPIKRFLSDTTTESGIEAFIAPYNQIYQLLLNDSHPVWQDEMDILVIWSTPQRVVPLFDKLYNNEEVFVEDILQEVEQFSDLITKASKRVKSIFVISWSLPPHLRWNQSMAYKNDIGLTNVLMQMNLLLSRRLSMHQNIIMLDSQYWYSAIQNRSFDPKLYAVGKINYTRDFFEFAAEEIRAAVTSIYGQTKKLIICDLDNTLWGGVIGDDGMNNILLGGIDPIGESFVLFQKELKRLKNRGVLLAISSKNNESIGMEMIENHPEMILRKNDFAHYQINWNDKVDNIARIVKDLNIGLHSVVFLDDNPIERDQVRHAFPEIFTPDLPKDITHYPSFLSSLKCFDTLKITREDRERTGFYQIESQRKHLLQEAGSKEKWLKSLGILVSTDFINKNNLQRAVQLLNKTNQFNMATNRYLEDEFWEFSKSPLNKVYVFHVSDKFGDSGLTGLISIRMDKGQLEIVDFVMSCRVMGKGIEDAMLSSVVSHVSKNSDIQTIKAIYKPTAQNQPFYDYISSKYNDKTRYTVEMSELNKPNHITIIQGWD